MRRLHSTGWGPGTRVHLRWTDADRTLCGRRVPWHRRPWPMTPCSVCARAYERVAAPDIHVDWVWQRSLLHGTPGSP